MEGEDELGLDASPLMFVGMLYAKWNGEFGSGTTASALQPIPGTMWDGVNWSESYDPCRSKMFAAAESLNVALVGIGHFGNDSDSGKFFKMLAKRGISESTFRRKNIVGEICNRPFDAPGQDLAHMIPEIRKHVDGVNIQVLKHLVNRNRIVIAIAGGKAKADAIRVALKHKFINILITDTEAAEATCAE